MSHIALSTARELHKGLLSAKATVEEKLASTPPSVRRYAQYQQLIIDYDIKIAKSAKTIQELSVIDNIIIAETESNKAKMATTQPQPQLKEEIYSILKSVK